MLKEKLYNSKTNVYVKINNEKKILLEKHSKFQFLEYFENNELNYKIINKTDFEKQNMSSIYFFRHFIDEVKNKFPPLELKYKNNQITVTNKDKLLEFLENETFNFFLKYPNKIEEINLILNDMKQGLKHENLEQEIDEQSLYPYLFKINRFIENREKQNLKSNSPEIISGYSVPSVINYEIKKFHRKKVVINFEEMLNEEVISSNLIKRELKKDYQVPETEPFEFDFIIKGYYIYNTETETVEKIEVDKEIKFYNVTTSTKRVLELEGFDENEKDEGRTYDEAVGELFEYLDKLGRKKEIDRQEFQNFVDEIAFSEKPKIFETLKWYIETNKIGLLELIEGERDRIYISEKEVLKVFEEIFDM